MICTTISGKESENDNPGIGFLNTLPKDKLTSSHVFFLYLLGIFLVLNSAAWISYGVIGFPKEIDLKILFYVTILMLLVSTSVTLYMRVKNNHR